MKKTALLSLVLAALLLVAGCASTPAAPTAAPTVDATTSPSPTKPPEATAEPAAPEAEGTLIRIATLKGPTGIGMVDLMERNEGGETSNQYEFTLAGAPEEIVGKITSGEVDVAAVPLNLASTLYNKTSGGVKIAAVNTLGVIYILERGESVQSVADLSGKTLYATGQGATPEYSLNYILSANGVTDTTVEYKTEHAELATLMISGEADLAILPEPFVSTVLSKAEDVRIALDMTKEWANAAKDSQGGEMITGCLIVRTEFLQENQAAFDAFMAEYGESTQAAVTDVPGTAQLTVQYGLMADAALAEKAIPNCNITFLTGAAMKDAVSPVLNVYYQANPQSIGGNTPDDSFYYLYETR